MRVDTIHHHLPSPMCHKHVKLSLDNIRWFFQPREKDTLTIKSKPFKQSVFIRYGPSQFKDPS